MIKSTKEKALKHLQNALSEVRQARFHVAGLGELQQRIKDKINELKTNY